MSNIFILFFLRVYAQFFYHGSWRVIYLKQELPKARRQSDQPVPSLLLFRLGNEKHRLFFHPYDTINNSIIPYYCCKKKEKPMAKYKNIVVYCGSRFGNSPAFASFAGRLGEALGKGGFHMIYGGGTVGLMGISADAAMAAGGKVTGIIPQVFIAKEQAHRGISELLEVPDMVTRKQKMINAGDAFIVLPGGIGTLEELADTFSHYRIYASPASRPPILIANIEGIYDPLKNLFQNWKELGFIEDSDLANIHFCSSLEEIIAVLEGRTIEPV